MNINELSGSTFIYSQEVQFKDSLVAFLVNFLKV